MIERAWEKKIEPLASVAPRWDTISNRQRLLPLIVWASINRRAMVGTVATVARTAVCRCKST